MASAFGVVSKKSWKSWRFVSPYVSSVSCKLYVYIYGKFWVNFCIWCEMLIPLHFGGGHTDIQSFPHYLLKKLPFLYQIALYLGWKSAASPASPVCSTDLSAHIFSYFLFRAAPAAYGSSEARGQIQAAAAGLHHSHSNSGSELHLGPTLQLMATPDPSPTERGQGSNPHPHGCLSASVTTEPPQELPSYPIWVSDNLSWETFNHSFTLLEIVGPPSLGNLPFTQGLFTAFVILLTEPIPKWWQNINVNK